MRNEIKKIGIGIVIVAGIGIFTLIPFKFVNAIYVNPDILQEDWDSYGSWVQNSESGSFTEISPAGQLYFDLRPITIDGYAGANKDIGTIGTDDYYLEVKFKGDVWDGFGTTQYGGWEAISSITRAVIIRVGNGFTAGDGIIIYDGSNWSLVYPHTWDNNWHTFVFYFHNNQTKVDIWVDKNPNTETADVIDANSTGEGSWGDGTIDLRGFGTLDGNGEYHMDYLYIGTELLSFCGNNIIENGEICDGTDLGSETCITKGFDSGTLACSGNCLSFDTNNCSYIIPPTAKIVPNIDSGFTSGMLAYVGNIFTDTKLFILLLAGLPLTFWFIRKVIGIFGGEVAKKSKDLKELKGYDLKSDKIKTSENWL